MLQRDKVFGRNMRSHPADVISPRSVMTALMAAVLVLGGCRDSFMKQATADKTSAIASLSATVDEAGNTTADFDPNSGQTQVLKLASGALAGSAVAIPPGSLAIPVSITVGEGETLASSSFTQQIGLTDNSVTAAGPSVSFIPSTNVQASSPFTLSLPFSLTSLALAAIDTENVIVMFRSIKVEGDQTSYEMGIIPRSEVTVSADKVSFQTKQFGVFQLAKTEKKITQRVKQPTIEVPVMKKEAGNPLRGAWESCRVDSGDSDTGFGTEPITWMVASSSGPFNEGNQWHQNISLKWSGGKGPYTISRDDTNGCPGSFSSKARVDAPGFEEKIMLAGAPSMVGYKIVDSQGTSSSCQPVQVITEPKIQSSSVGVSTTSTSLIESTQAEPNFRVSNILSSPTAINFSWNPEGIDLGRVTLSQHQGFDCDRTESNVTPLSPMSAANTNVQKVMGLAKGVSYSFKLKTTDVGVPEVCFNATTTDGDLPFMMPNAETTLKFSAATTVNDGKTYKLLLSRDGSQIETASTPFDKSNNSAAILLVAAKGTDFQNKSMMVLAPNGCQFILGAKKFMNFSINESNTVYEAGTNGGTATVTTGDLKVECNSGGKQHEGGDVDKLGYVPGRAYSRLNKLKIGKDAFIMRQEVFTSKYCTGDPVSSNTEQGVFVLPAVDVEGTIPLDITQKDLEGTIFTKEGVDIANKLPMQFGCGLSGWVQGKERKLVDSKCGEVGKTSYQRLKVNGDRLYMCSSGSNNDSSYGETPAMRILSCDITNDMEYFTRQK